MRSAAGGGGVRIEAGALKGRVLTVPGGARPTGGRVRGALAAIWVDRLEGARLLELYAGSGAVSLELLSRGALSAVLVESNRGAIPVLKRNLRLAPPGAARLLAAPVELAVERLSAQGERFDLIFADPPYATGLDPSTLVALADLAAPGAELAVEHDRRTTLPMESGRWVRREERRYGETALSFYGLTG